MKAEKTISNISSVLGILGFIGTIVTGILGEFVAALVLIGLTLLFWLIWLTIKVISLSNQVARINIITAPLEKFSSQVGRMKMPRIEKHLEETSYITSGRKNEFKINSNIYAF